MNITVGTVMRAAALVIFVLLAVFTPARELLWMALDGALLAAGTLIP